MTFGILFLIVVAGLLGPILSGNRRFPIPMVVGEIAAGLIIGKSGFHLLNTSDPTLTFFSNFGFALLLFLVGTNLPLRDPNFKKALRKGLLATGFAYALAIPFGIGLALLTGVHNVGILVLLCACSSTSVVLRIVDERKLRGSSLTVATTWIPLADMSTLVLLPLAVAGGAVVSVIVGAVVVTLAGIAAFIALKKFRSSGAGERYRQLSKERGWALDLRLSLAILLGLAWLSTMFGISVIVAGFVGGAVVTLIGTPNRHTKQLIGLAEGLFVPLFFVDLGAKLNVSQLFNSASDIELAVLLSVAGLIVHLIAGKLVKLPSSTSMMAAASMGLPAAVVSTGLASGFLNSGQAAAIVAAALLSLVWCSIGTARYIRQSNGNNTEEPLHLPEHGDE